MDLEGPLIDDAKAHILQYWHAFRERNRPGVAPDLQPNAGVLLASALIELDAERPLRRETFDQRDVLDSLGRRIHLAGAHRKRIAIAREQRLRPAGRLGLGQRCAERIAPGAHNGADRLLQRLAIRIGGLTAVAADDEMNP